MSVIVNTMDILFVVPYTPNLIRVRPYNFIRSLTRRGHRVTVLTTWSDAQEREAVEQLRRECYQVRAVPLPRWRSALNCVAALPSQAPLQAAYCWSPALVSPELLDGLQPDVIHVEHLRGARYGLHLKQWSRRLGRPVPVIWDSVDCISLLFRHAAARSRRLTSRLMTRLELKRTERYERWLIGQFDRVLVTAPADRDGLLGLDGAARPASGEPLAAQSLPDLRVIPNGVDLDYFRLEEGIPREPATLVVSGKMSYHANVTMVMHFVQAIFPRIRAKRPDVKLWIVGKEPTAEIQALAQDPAVSVSGTVADLRPYLWGATIAVAPVAYGVGIQNKVLEAMACGAPVVSTPQSVSALQLEPNQDALVAQDPASFAEAVVNLLDDPGRRADIGRAGRRYVEAYHDWSSIAARLEETYHGIPVSA